MARISKRSVRLAIEGCSGNVTAVAEALGCTRQTVYNYLEKYPDLRAKLDDEREVLVDKAENKLETLIDQGVLGAVLFTLETLGKRRGWSKRTEITGANGKNLIEIPASLASKLEALGVGAADLLRDIEESLD